MGWLGRIFGTDKAVDNIVDKDNGLLVRAGTAIGNLHYSDQEKANDNLATKEWGLRLLDSLAPFKVVQRILAFGAMLMWITVALNYMIMLWLQHPAADKLLAFALSDYVFWPVMAIFALYTGGGTLNSLKGSK